MREMGTDNYSTSVRPVRENSDHPTMIYLDASSKLQRYDGHEFFAVNDIEELATSIACGEYRIDDRSSNQAEDESGARYWFRQAWHPSYELFVSSRRDGSGGINWLGWEGAANSATHIEASERKPSLGEVLMRRRTGRAFKKVPVKESTVRQVAQLAASGELLVEGGGIPHHRASLLFDLFVIAYDVRGLLPGVYKYESDGRFSSVRDGLFRVEMEEVLAGMPAPRTASATLVMVSNWPAILGRDSRDWTLRGMYQAAGAYCQRLLIASEAEGLSALPTPAFQDSQLARLLMVDGIENCPIYSLTIGFRSKNGYQGLGDEMEAIQRNAPRSLGNGGVK